MVAGSASAASVTIQVTGSQGQPAATVFMEHESPRVPCHVKSMCNDIGRFSQGHLLFMTFLWQQ